MKLFLDSNSPMYRSTITVLSYMEKESTFGFFDTKSDKKDLKKRNKAMQEKISKMKESAETSLALNLTPK